ncbi:rRNA pseudouridine synthase [Candidatus Parcubacteria bacterium]|nr:MAG: rRNA pseudouridine synthase [Candidatus Parcubacteria bacterium]
MEYPLRINKYLAANNYCSRREADDLISSGLIKINGRTAKLGDKVLEGDNVEVNSEANKTKQLLYFAYNKPAGIVTHSAEREKGQKGISDIAAFPKSVFPVGRLDKASHGLIILTNDGRVTGKLLSPDKKAEKEYFVKVDKPLRPGFFAKAETGIDLGDFITKPCKIKQINERAFKIILTEGKKHQIRRMCEAFGYKTLELQRVRVMNVRLGNLKDGQWRQLEGKELREFLSKLDFNRD